MPKTFGYRTHAKSQRRMIDDQLRPGETVKWTGTPDPGAFAKIPRLWAQTVFGSGYALFALTFIGEAAASVGGGIGLAFLLVPLMFFAIGVYMASVMLRLGWRAVRTIYAITDQRVLIVEQKNDGAVTSTIAPAEISQVMVRRSADGSGTIRLRDTWGKAMFAGSVDFVTFDDALWGVADVAEASAAIDALRLPRP